MVAAARSRSRLPVRPFIMSPSSPSFLNEFETFGFARQRELDVRWLRGILHESDQLPEAVRVHPIPEVAFVLPLLDVPDHVAIGEVGQDRASHAAARRPD